MRSTISRVHPSSPVPVPAPEPAEAPYAPPARRSRWTTPLAFAAWFGVNLMMLAPDFRGAVLPGGRTATGGLTVLLAVPSSLLMTAMAWLAFRLTRYTVARGGWMRRIALHAAAGMGVSLLNVLLRKGERGMLESPGEFGAGRDAPEFLGVFVIYTAIVLVAHALAYARRYRERRLAELRLQASLARAELERTAAELRVLKLQLNPHFLFNSLHAVSALVHDAPDAAERMVLRLGDLLRSAAGRVGTQEVPLDEEVRTLQRFLEVERIRLGGRLRVEWAIDGGAGEACVPHMVLQPLVENAIKHGLAPRPDGGCVRIAARRSGPWLELSVRDDGVGPAAAAGRSAAGAGIGTTNTRARLAQLYGDDQALEIAPAEGGGTRVSLRIPWHRTPVPGRALQGPPPPEEPAGSRRRWPGVLATALLFAALAPRAIISLRGMGAYPARSMGLVEAVVCGTLSAAVLTLLIVTAFTLARRAPVAAGGATRALGRHARAAVAIALLWTVERYGCHVLWGTPLSLLTTGAAVREMAAYTALSIALFAGVSVVAHGVEYARRARVTQAASLRLQTALARAELERTSAELRGLKMQLNPAYLFTALEAVAERVRHAPGDAERMVVRLADLLRQSMAGGGRVEAPLEEEVRGLAPFLEVERIRRGGLRVEEAVDDEALDALVPHLLLQPLLMQGAGGEGGCIAIAAGRRGDWLEVEVRGMEGADVPGGAAAETRARLARMYGAGCAVESRGGRTTVRLPWHEEPWPTAAALTEDEGAAR
jgi:LytS/YehU family sensor histidine kinase